MSEREIERENERQRETQRENERHRGRINVCERNTESHSKGPRVDNGEEPEERETTWMATPEGGPRTTPWRTAATQDRRAT